MFKSFINQHRLSDDFIEVAKANFVPLADTIISKRQRQMGHQKGPFFVGINGCQGSGKSTLSAFICDCIQHKTALNVIVLSLDDFYFSKQIRSELAATVHPLLKTRGVPGTHNTAHINAIFKQLTQATGTLALPRFDKASDNPFATEQWPSINLPVDIVLFEGWCWGVAPQEPQALISPINTLESQWDPDGQWRRYVNRVLAEDYLPLYAQMDFWILLQAPSFDCVYQWRLEQENKLRLTLNSKDNSGIMSDSQVLQFIQYYQRLTEHALATLAGSCDVVFYLDSQRQIEKTIVNKRENK